MKKSKAKAHPSKAQKLAKLRATQGAALSGAPPPSARIDEVLGEEFFVEPLKIVDTPTSFGVRSQEVEAIQPDPIAAQQPEQKTMILTLKSLNKKGTRAIYAGAAVTIQVGLTAFPNKTAPQSIEVADGVFAVKVAKEAKSKLTPEERKTLRASKPKPTLAELAARAQERANKLAAKAAAAQSSL